MASREELIKLPGVGRKMANVILSSAFNRAAIAVDTHVFRVANRIWPGQFLDDVWELNTDVEAGCQSLCLITSLVDFSWQRGVRADKSSLAAGC